MSLGDQLRFYLEQLRSEAPSRAAEAVESIIVLIRANQIELAHLDKSQKPFSDMRVEYLADPAAFNQKWSDILLRLRRASRPAAHREVKSVTGFVFLDSEVREAAEQVNKIADITSELIEWGLAEEAVSRIDESTVRAKRLSKWEVGQASSESADLYLNEACFCFIYGFFTASAVMCRSLLEEVLERTLPSATLRLAVSERAPRPTLGSLLGAVKKRPKESALKPEIIELAERVNQIGNKAAHDGSLSQEEVFECLDKTRHVTLYLLQRVTA